MKYFLILGTNPSLSLAEIDSYFKKIELDFSIDILSKDLVFLNTEKELKLEKIIKELGGVIKIGHVVLETKKLSVEDFMKVLENKLANVDYKFKFGFSFYGVDLLPLSKIAMNIKNSLKSQGISSRWVTSKEKSLSSVIVEQNKLIDRGVDFFIFREGKTFFIGRTSVVQDFKGLSKRDYGRPAKDDASGMLPPKLAQIMINISSAKEDKTLLDPFCGSGTVIMEAALMNIKKLYGSDLSKKAVEDTQKNINWLKRSHELDMDLVLKEIDATKISKEFEESSIDTIVTEPYLGPQRGSHDIKKTVNYLEGLYSRSLEEFAKILKKNGSVVMVWPVFVSREGDKKKYFLDNVSINNFEIIPLLSAKYLDNNFTGLSRRGGIVYGRLGQKIWREIVLLRLK